MSARRLYAADLPAAGGEVSLAPDVAKHARVVLRLGVGDRVVLFDGRSHEADAVVVEANESGLRCRAEAWREVAGDTVRVSLIQALPKGGKIDDIVRMCTEIGVHEIYLASSERTIPELGDRAAKRVERLSRIAREASRQSNRSEVPIIHPPRSLHEAARLAPADSARILFWEMHRGGVELAPLAQSAWLIIGPEGGLSEREVAPLVDTGWSLAGLGPTVLRVETAGPVAVAIVRDRLRQCVKA